MSNDARVGVLVKMSPALKRAIVERADSVGRSMNDVCVEILSQHYKVPFKVSTRRTEPSAEKLIVLLRVSDRLKMKIQLDAVKSRSKQGATCASILADALGVNAPLAAAA